MRHTARRALLLATVACAVGLAAVAGSSTPPPASPAPPSPPAPAPPEFPEVAGEHPVLVTVDDLPIPSRALHPDDAERERITRGLLSVLARHHVRAVGFVVGRNLGKERDERLLDLWLQAGHELGNHTLGHLDLSATAAEAWVADGEKGRARLAAFLEARGARLRFFRFPFLREGETLEKLRAVRRWLAESCQGSVPVTIDGQDWSWEGPWVEARRRGDQARLRALGESYQQALRLEVLRHTATGDALLGRPTPQVLLLHANEVGAAQWDALFTWMEGRGFRFAAADEVLADPAFALPHEHVGRYGASLWLRLQQERRLARARAGVLALVEQQVAAWNRGDVAGFCEAYAEDALFVSPSGLTRGRAEVEARYRRRYPDGKAMGTLAIEPLEVRELWGPEVSLLGDAEPGAVHAVRVVARWTIRREGQEDATGLTLIVFRREAGRWWVVEDASM